MDHSHQCPNSTSASVHYTPRTGKGHLKTVSTWCTRKELREGKKRMEGGMREQVVSSEGERERGGEGRRIEDVKEGE